MTVKLRAFLNRKFSSFTRHTVLKNCRYIINLHIQTLYKKILWLIEITAKVVLVLVNKFWQEGQQLDHSWCQRFIVILMCLQILKWNFIQLTPEYVEQLTLQMEKNFSKGMMDMMYNVDFKQHTKAIEILIKVLTSNLAIKHSIVNRYCTCV